MRAAVTLTAKAVGEDLYRLPLNERDVFRLSASIANDTTRGRA
jgi:hypothetical protein